MADELRVDAPTLASILGTWVHGDGALYQLLARALVAAIDAGALAAGTVLPPERHLAQALSLSRSTVVSAYDRLKEQGWLDSRQGSGTWVRRTEHEPADTDAVTARRLFAPTVPSPSSQEPVEFVVAAPDGLPMVGEELRRLPDTQISDLLAHHGYLPVGLPQLRDAVADGFERRGVPTTRDEVLVTTGVHQAIALVARQLLRAGDAVLVESPSFPGALDVYRSVGARVVPVPVDRDGLRVDILHDVLRRTPARLIHVAPTFHNPTGTVLVDERRRDLVDLARRTGTVVVEDLALVDVALGDDPAPPPLGALDSEAPVVTVGSMTKLFWAGLRTGWIRAGPGLVTRLQRTKTVADLGSPLLDQAVSVRLLARADEARTARRAQLRPRLELMEALLHELLPDWTWTTPVGGVSLWITLPHGSGEGFGDVALRHGVSFVSGPSLSVDEGNRRCLRLVFAPDEDTIERGVRRLAAAWREYTPEALGRPTSRLLV